MITKFNEYSQTKDKKGTYLQRLDSYLPDEVECFKYTTCKDY